MKNIKRKVLFSVIEFLVQAVLMSVLPFIVMIDIVVIGKGPTEISATEITQEITLVQKRFFRK